MTDAEKLWGTFLDEACAANDELARVAGLPAPDATTLRKSAGEMFELTAGATLLGIEPAAVAGGYAERLLLAVADGRPWSEVQSALTEMTVALGAGLLALRNPDASGARIEDQEAIRASIARLGSLFPEESEAPPAPAPQPMETSDSALPVDETLWVPQVDEDMIDPFLEEAGERTEALSQKLLQLEARPDDVELVREIFRDLHTIKGSSGFVGLHRMNRLAHAAEDLVGQVRDGTRAVDRALVDSLLAALDGLKAILDAATRGAGGAHRLSGVRIDVEIDRYLAGLRAPELRAQSVQAAPASSASAPVSEKSAEGKQTLRVDFEKLDGLLNLVGELVLSKARLHATSASLAALQRELDGQLRRAQLGRGTGALLDEIDRFQRIYAELTSDLQDGAGELDHVSGELRQQVMKLRMVPIGRVFTRYHRTVRELANGLGKQVRLELDGAETELDKVLIEQLEEPLLHLVRNALDHGIEPPEVRRQAGKPPEGQLTLSAHHRGNQILIEVGDDGAGIDPQKLRKKALEKDLATQAELDEMDDKRVLDVIFRPGFSTAARITEVSGRGVGMDVVRNTITRLSGTIEIASEPGVGTRFLLRLPLTLAIIQVLVVKLAGDEYALPLDAVVRTLAARPEQIHRVYDRDLLLLGDEQVPLLWLGEALELGGSPTIDEELPVILVNAAGELYGLVVDRLVGKREIVLKTLGDLLSQVPCAAGATLLGDRVALILDVVQVVQRGLQRRAATPIERRATPRAPQLSGIQRVEDRRPRVLLAEDSDLIREQLRRVLEAHGCDVVAARDGAEALTLAERDTAGFDLVSTDVMMPALDGYQLTRALRAHPRHKSVPIVMVTSRSEHIDRVRGFDAGVDEYLVKPLDSGELVRALERHLKKRGRTP